MNKCPNSFDGVHVIRASPEEVYKYINDDMKDIISIMKEAGQRLTEINKMLVSKNKGFISKEFTVKI